MTADFTSHLQQRTAVKALQSTLQRPLCKVHHAPGRASASGYAPGVLACQPAYEPHVVDDAADPALVAAGMMQRFSRWLSQLLAPSCSTQSCRLWTQVQPCRGELQQRD